MAGQQSGLNAQPDRYVVIGVASTCDEHDSSLSDIFIRYRQVQKLRIQAILAAGQQSGLNAQPDRYAVIGVASACDEKDDFLRRFL